MEIGGRATKFMGVRWNAESPKSGTVATGDAGLMAGPYPWWFLGINSITLAGSDVGIGTLAAAGEDVCYERVRGHSFVDPSPVVGEHGSCL